MDQEQMHLWVMAISLLAATLFLGISSVNILIMQRSKNAKNGFDANVGQSVQHLVLNTSFAGHKCNIKHYTAAAA